MTHYQLTKTLRFGLTKVRKEKKHLSHEALDELVMVSEYHLIKKNVLELADKQGKDKSNVSFAELDKRFAEIINIQDKEQRNAEYVEFLNEFFKDEKIYATKRLDEQSFVDSIRECSDGIKAYLLSWGKVCRRIDKITVRKEFFKILARKTFFKYESKTYNNRTHKSSPLPSEVKLSGQKEGNYYDEPINEGISQYWQKTVSKALKLHSQLESMLSDYKKAIETEKHNQDNPKGDNDPFDKLHLVDFRKMFLSVCSLVMDSLRPIVNELIVVSDNISKEDDKFILVFVNSKSEQCDLFNQIEKLQNTIRDNGGNVLFGKATLNKYTSEQVPNHQIRNIEKTIDDLKLKEFVSEFIDLSQDDIRKKLYTLAKYNLENLSESHISPIIRAQYFKYKPIPVLVRFALANYLSNQKKEKYSGRFSDIMQLFRIFGMSQSPAVDYSDKNKRDKFSFDNYPIKVSFDYAWEQCARAKYSKMVDFPKEKCETFLSENFKYQNQYNSKAFDIYARLLKVNECLATLEHFEKEPPKDIVSIYDEAKSHLEFLKNTKVIEEKYYESIEKWYEEYSKKWKDGKFVLKKWLKSNNSIITNFTDTKMRLGQKRGSQKSFVLKSYKYNIGKEKTNITEVFRDIASFFGKKFATLRDYFNEESEVNKIGFGAVIIEDDNRDKYLLLQKKNEGGHELPIFTTTCKEGDCVVYQVQSLTYKSVNKIYESDKYPDFFAINKVEGIIKKEKRPFKFNSDQEKINFNNRKLKSLKKCLTLSDFIKNPNENYLERFKWTNAINQCTNLDELAKLIDQKGYYLKESKISKTQINDLVNKHNCLLFPIVNQNITASAPNDKNQFTKDWNRIFDEEEQDYRLHPEFTMFYRFPTPDYPCPGEKRYSRFQVNVNFLMEVIPSEGEYVSRKEQIESFNTPKQDKEGNDNINSQAKKVEQFNDNINTKKPSYIIGIDRGINELATLCVINSNGKIVGVDDQGNIKDEFDIYIKRFDKDRKCWIHNIKPKADNRPRSILDLSNLRVETTIDGKQVLVDLSSDEKGEPVNTKQIVHLKHLYYLRCLTYLLQSSEYQSVVLDNLKNCDKMTDEQIYNVFKNSKLVDTYKGGKQYTDLPCDDIKKLILDFNAIANSNKTESEKYNEFNQLCQLDATESLKKGVVANMIGVVVYILKKLNYDAYISLENLCRAYNLSKDALSGYAIESTNMNQKLDFKDQENAKLAGLGTYSYFEIQLLKKLFKLQIEEKQLLVPAFRSVENYEKIFQLEDVKNKIYQFGIVFFVDPANTSHSCPICGANGKKNVDRKKHNDKYDEDELVCKQCGFHSNLSHIETNDKVMEDSFIKKYYVDHNLSAIISGDANAGYNIAFRLGKNIIPEMGKEIDKLHNAGSKYKKIK